MDPNEEFDFNFENMETLAAELLFGGSDEATNVEQLVEYIGKYRASRYD